MSAAYNFTRSGAGDYYIEPSNLFTYIDVDGTPKNIHATVRDVAGVKLSGNLTFFRVSDERPRGGYPGCTANDMNMLAAAAETAQDYAYDAYSYLKGIRDSTPLYSFWFGVYSHGRRRIVQEKFRWMNSRRFSNYIYDCNCVDGRPDEPAYVRVYIFRSRRCKLVTDKSHDQGPMNPESSISAVPSGENLRPVPIPRLGSLSTALPTSSPLTAPLTTSAAGLGPWPWAPKIQIKRS